MAKVLKIFIAVLMATSFIKGQVSAENLPSANLDVSVSNKQVGNGYEYDYRFKNTGDKALIQFTILTPEQQAGSGQMPIIKECWVPTGWTGQATTMGNQTTMVVWVSTGNPGSDLAPGAEVGGFGFISDSSSGKASFSARDSSMAELKGDTTGPAVGGGTGATDGTAKGNVVCQTK